MGLAYSGSLLQNTSPITMDPAVCFCLRQGDHPLEAYVEEFCELCSQVDFNDFALNDFFFCLMPDNTPHWTQSKYTDFALLLDGSPLQ